VLGGYGYTRDFPVEQYWRDNRLNMIHEGTHGIQALDLLGRKVVMGDGAGLARLCETIEATIVRARNVKALVAHADALAAAVGQLVAATRAAWETDSPQEALANATPYLQAFGHVVLAWIWLDVALCAAAAVDDAAQRGRLAACRFFFHYELPKIGAWLEVVERRDDTCRTMAEDWF
jgi:butyryl-CoA dehydrogenase